MSTQDLMLYKTLPEWDMNSLPKAFKNKHNTKEGTWAKLSIFSGELKYYELDEDDNVLDSCIFNAESDIPLVEPQAWHKVEPLSDDLRCQLSFYCQPNDYYQKKYQISAIHSEVLAMSEYISSGSALDFGCGSGRNSLHLQRLGFDVTAFDRNPVSIENLQKMIAAEKLEHISAFIKDANESDIEGEYDLIINTVVLMFLQESRIPSVIKDMQHSTRSGGYNLIVCALDCDEYPMSNYSLPFGFGFAEGELKTYYQDWNIVKYNEDVGHLHRLDDNGNPIALRFATLIAQKP